MQDLLDKYNRLDWESRQCAPHAVPPALVLACEEAWRAMVPHPTVMVSVPDDDATWRYHDEIQGRAA